MNRMQEHLVANQAERISGVPLSAVEQQDTHRKDKVKRLIEKFENHPNKESFLQDFKQTKEINEFSKKSHNTEIFELCETSSKQQCLDCYLFWEAGIVYCSCGRCLRISRNEKEVDKSNNDVVSIPGCVVKKKNMRGARHGPSEGQRMYNNARKCCIKQVILKLNQDGAQHTLNQDPAGI